MTHVSSRRVSALVALLPLALATCTKSDSATGPSGADFAPSVNTTLSGSVTYKSVTIPAGVTVTVSSDLTLTVQGDMKLMGTLKGNCVGITIKASGVFTNTAGTLDNSCAAEPDAGGPGVLVIGAQGINADGGELITSGDLRITNDPGQTLATPAGVLSQEALNGGRFAAQATGGVPCTYRNYSTRSVPPSRSKGANGSPKGVDGGDGHFKDLGPCAGGINISGLTMSGQKGGDGGDGTVTGSTTTVGGKGGNAGAMLITAPGGNIVFTGTNTITTPDGGAGGNGTGTGLTGGGNAAALGGAGGDASPTGFGGSPITISASSGTITVNGSLNIVVGKAGNAGNAIATGGKGNDGSPGQPGGTATATGGAGGKSADKKFTATGSVGGNGTTVSGGNAGKGGDGTANGGIGGNGNPGQAGGKGGNMTAQGGNGGSAQLRNAGGALTGAGGDAGNARYTLGNGGVGGSNCPAAGGAGGGGGDAAGGAGTPGTGATAGAGGNAQANGAGNGNKGGDGNPAGGGGPKGNNTPPANPAPGSFVPGQPGGPCAGGVTLTVTPTTLTVNQGGQGSVHLVVGRTGAFAGEVTATVKDDLNNVRATQTIAATATQADMTFTVPGTSTPGSHTYTVTVSGTGAAPVSQTVGVTVAAVSAVNVPLTFGEQATKPVTKLVVKTGSSASVTVPVAANGSATISVPTTSTTVTLAIQQTVGNDRHTFVYLTKSEELLLNPPSAFSFPARGQLTSTVSGVPANSVGNAFAGSATTSFPVQNSGSFMLQLNGVETGFQVLGGCNLKNASQDPVSAILGVATYANSGGYVCNFAGPGTKNYISTAQTVLGVTAGTQLVGSGGFWYNNTSLETWSKGFMAPSTSFSGLNAVDLPSGALQWQSVQRIGVNAFELKSYYFTQAANWSPTIGPALSNPTVSLTSINPFYSFQVQMASQPEYSGAWTIGYSQSNSFGGTNDVVSVWTAASLGTTVPSALTFNTFADLQLDASYMPKPGNGSVVGYVFGQSNSVLQSPTDGFTRALAGKFNVVF